MKIFWICNYCNKMFEENKIYSIQIETKIVYRGVDIDVICKKCHLHKHNKEVLII